MKEIENYKKMLNDSEVNFEEGKIKMNKSSTKNIVSKNGIFVGDQKELANRSWDLLLRKANKDGTETIKKLTPSEKILKDLREMGVFD